MFCALKIFVKSTNIFLIVRRELRMTSFQNATKWPQTTANCPYPSSSYNNNNNNNNISSSSISTTTVNNNHSTNNPKYRGRCWRESKWRRSW